jgi:hypothetical protein
LVDTVNGGLPSHPDVAFDGTNALVVWQDSAPSQFNQGIYGARVAGDGTVLGEVVVRTPASGVHTDPAVSFSGGNFLVAWTDDGTGSNAILGRRVDTTGVLLDPAGFLISAGSGPDVASDGTDHLVGVERQS